VKVPPLLVRLSAESSVHWWDGKGKPIIRYGIHAIRLSSHQSSLVIQSNKTPNLLGWGDREAIRRKSV